MKTKLLYSTLLSIILLFVGCVKEDNTQLQSGPEATLLLNVPTRTVGSGEDEIKEVRVVSFVPEDAGNAAGWMEVNGGRKALESNPITQILRTGVRDVYVFANETAVDGLTAQLEGMRSLADLKAIQLPYDETLTPPFLCSCVLPNLPIEKEPNASIEADVVRTVSKVALTLKYKLGADTDMLPEELVIDQVQVKQLPKYSYLVGKPYEGDDFVVSKVLAGDALTNRSTQPNEYKSDELILYIPEFLGATAAEDRHAFIEIIGSLKSNSGIKCKYKIPLGDGMEANSMTDYNITRNTQFEIDATIKSYGDKMFVEVNVVPWSTVDQSEDVGRFVSYEKVTDATGNVIVDGGLVHEDGMILKVTCKTNIGGWYAVARDKDGKLVDTSLSTESVSSAAKQIVEISIPKIIGESQEYTVSIYHPTIAMESVDPVKSLTFLQFKDNGFIPNAILTAAGWPADQLPSKGLQLAKRGNGVKPDKTAEETDVWRKWKTSQTTTVGTVKDLGMGISNTNKMAGEEHPAATYCRAMGNEWFLPSQEELSLIYKNKSMLGSSYTFNAYADSDPDPRYYHSHYWSSTEINAQYSFLVYFLKGGTSEGSKDVDLYSVRCVKYN